MFAANGCLSDLFAILRDLAGEHGPVFGAVHTPFQSLQEVSQIVQHCAHDQNYLMNARFAGQAHLLCVALLPTSRGLKSFQRIWT